LRFALIHYSFAHFFCPFYNERVIFPEGYSAMHANDTLRGRKTEIKDQPQHINT
jgi:hypothetical protein